MKVFILGATGALGKIVTNLALQKGIEVKAFVRNPAKMNVQHPKLEIVQGNILNETDVNNAIKGVDAVVWAIGHENKKAVKRYLKSKNNYCFLFFLNSLVIPYTFL